MTFESDTADLGALLDHLKGTRNFDFKAYKRPSLRRRIERRMQVVGAADFSSYRDYLANVPDEFVQLFIVGWRLGSVGRVLGWFRGLRRLWWK